MAPPTRPYERATSKAARRRRTRRRRQLFVAAATIIVAVGAGALVWAIVTHDRGAAAAPLSTTQLHPAPARVVRHVHVAARLPLHLAEHPAGRLPFGIQDPAAVSLAGGGIALLGGLGATDLSLNEALIVRRGSSHALGRLPKALHDAPGARIGGRIFVFGGGDGVRQLDSITGVEIATGRTYPAGSLPAPSSDSAATTLGNTAYIVGGYTGTTWLDTIVAWRPGQRGRVVAHLPSPVRYAAVTAAHGVVVIAGGSLPDGTASRLISTYDPRSNRIRTIGHLPVGTTHAAAASIGDVAYVIGGRGAATNSPTARILAIDPSTGRIRSAGSLTVAASDLAAVSDGGAILVAGGRGLAGTRTQVSLLKPAAQRTASAANRTLTSVYARTGAGMLTGAARFALPRVYVPNSDSNTVDVIDPKTYRIVGHFAVGALPQHVTPAWNLRTLYVDNDLGNSLTPIDPRTGKPKGPALAVADPYNLYFTPDGRSAIVVAERLQRLDFRNPTTFRLQQSLAVPCRGVDHMDFTADGRFALASCEFSGQLVADRPPPEARRRHA